MAEQICTNCGYEGRGKRMGERKGGGVARVAGILTLLPFYTLWQLGGRRAGKVCPHCSLPRMVKLNSAEGIIARRKLDIELGFITPKTEEKPVAETFGNERPAQVNVTKKPVDPEQW